ncbi:MAG: hypothetical protein LHV68_00165 [Elusimicrobia bacterium]|nr:hypothetical protein [Candidatus Liberimonas magnetica]
MNNKMIFLFALIFSVIIYTSVSITGFKFPEFELNIKGNLLGGQDIISNIAPFGPGNGLYVYEALAIFKYRISNFAGPLFGSGYNNDMLIDKNILRDQCRPIIIHYYIPILYMG